LYISYTIPPMFELIKNLHLEEYIHSRRVEHTPVHNYIQCIYLYEVIGKHNMKIEDELDRY